MQRAPNDPEQYDDLADEWWDAGGRFAALHWIAAARAPLIPPPSRPDAVLLDLACGAGLMAPHVTGYRHIGLDLIPSALHLAREQGLLVVRGDVLRLPFADASADVVVAGEIFEHIADVDRFVAEIARVLRPGGTLAFDTINDTLWARVSLVWAAERLPGGPPPGIHDPALFVPPGRLARALARHGIRARVRGLRPSARDYARFLMDRAQPVRMLPTRSTAALYQGVGAKLP